MVAERGPCVLVIDRGTGPASVLAFVLAIVGVVFGGFGVVALVMAATGAAESSPSVPVAAVLLVVGLAAVGGVIAVVRSIRRRRAAPLDSYSPVAVFDRARRLYLDDAGTVVAALDHVRFQRSMQLTSSSPTLVAVTPRGTRVLARANPFSGGIGNLDAVLTHAVR